MPVQSWESERSCIYVLGLSIAPLLLRFSDWIMELMKTCYFLFFSFHMHWVFVVVANMTIYFVVIIIMFI